MNNKGIKIIEIGIISQHEKTKTNDTLKYPYLYLKYILCDFLIIFKKYN